MQDKRDSAEVRAVIDNYFSGNAILQYKDVSSATSEFIRIFCSGKPEFVDSPDLVITEGNNVLIIEHFEFDNFKSAVKGSRNRIEQARIDRIVGMITPTEEGAMYHDQICGESSLNYYESNAISQFRKHYEKIEKYNTRIRELGFSSDISELRVVFIIEDKSPLGTLVHDGERMLAVTLAHDRRFLELFKDKPSVDYVINCYSAFNQRFIWIIPYSQLSEYEKDILHYDQMQFFAATPQVGGFNLLIPKE
jgi:hypothetical protein